MASAIERSLAKAPADRYSTASQFAQALSLAQPAAVPEWRRPAEDAAGDHGEPPGYQRLVSWWVISAKREETRVKRLGTLIRDSAAGLRIGPLRRPPETRSSGAGIG